MPPLISEPEHCFFRQDEMKSSSPLLPRFLVPSKCCFCVDVEVAAKAVGFLGCLLSLVAIAYFVFIIWVAAALISIAALIFFSSLATGAFCRDAEDLHSYLCSGAAALVATACMAAFWFYLAVRNSVAAPLYTPYYEVGVGAACVLVCAVCLHHLLAVYAFYEKVSDENGEMERL